MSVEGCIYYCWPFLKREDSSDENAAAVSKLLHAEVSPITKDPNGRVSGGKITLKGPLRHGQWAQSETWKIAMQHMDEHNDWDGTALFDHRSESPQPGDSIALVEGSRGVATGVAPFAMALFDDDNERPQYVDFLLLTERQGIILLAIDEQKARFRRIGFFRINGSDREWGEIQTVVHII